MEAATKRAKQCQAEAKAGPTETKPPATEAQCNARASERLSGIERRHTGDPAGQAGSRGEEVQVSAELTECIRRARGGAERKANP